MAVREGFEPSERNSPFNGLAIHRFRPLSQRTFIHSVTCPELGDTFVEGVGYLVVLPGFEPGSLSNLETSNRV